MEEELANQLDMNSDDDSRVPAAHKKLLGAVSKLYEKKRVKAPTRKEPSLEVSEFHLSQLDRKRGTRIKVTDLAKVLNKRATHTDISHKLKAAHKRAKTLPKPLEKIHADKISRAAGYEHARRQLNRWDAIVYKHKVADQLCFPLTSDTVNIQGSTEPLKMFRKPTELELKLAEILKQPNLLAEQEIKKAEEEEEYPLSLSEIIEKRKMMAKLRAQQSYRQAKAARHSKIKSKKFHQIQRKARMKEQLREFEELQKKDPEAALQKLEELERARAEERVTLRHRSTGQWAKNLAVRAKYDKEARIALAEQLSKSRELTVKLGQNKDSESEKEEEEQVQPEPAEEDPNNPWVVKRTREMEDFVSGYRKYWETKQQEGQEIRVGRSSETKICDKEHNELQIDSGTKDKLCDLNNYGSSNSITYQKDKQIVSSKNVFTINDTDSNDKVIRPTVNLSSTQVKKTNAVKYGEPLRADKKLKNMKLICKSSSWHVTEVKNLSAKQSSKMSRNEIEPRTVKAIGNLFEITESKVIPEEADLESRVCNKDFKTNRPEKERADKVKSLDEIFEEVEDKLQTSVKDKIEKIKGMFNRKRKFDIVHDTESESEKVPSLELTKKKKYADVDEELQEQPKKNGGLTPENNLLVKIQATVSAEVKSTDDIDPNKFLKVTPMHLSSKLPNIMTEGEDALDNEETTAKEKHLTISEAFAEDDVVDQFQKEKEEDVKKCGLGDVDLSLPGWGSWAGHNMKPVSRRKRKKFIIKFPKAIPRRDTNRGNVIINEDADKPIKEHQVSDVPFPFTSVKDYEASVRMPLGSTWLSQMAHRKLTLPPVVTKLGTVIQPMDDSQLVTINNKRCKKFNKT